MRKTIILSESEIRSIISRVHRMGGLINEGLEAAKNAAVGTMKPQNQDFYDKMVKQIVSDESVSFDPGTGSVYFTVIGDNSDFKDFLAGPNIVSTEKGNEPTVSQLMQNTSFFEKTRAWVPYGEIDRFLKGMDEDEDGTVYLAIGDRSSLPTGVTEPEGIKKPTSSGLVGFQFVFVKGKIRTVKPVYNPYHIAKFIVYLKFKKGIEPDNSLSSFVDEIITNSVKK